MNINYIVLAHKNPEQLHRLIHRLNEKWVKFYVHIDKNRDITPFKLILKNFPNVFFLDEINRYEGTWGDIGIVKATLSALSIIADQNPKGYCILITGQDYPLKSNVAIQKFLEDHYGNNFISIFQTPNSWGEPYEDRIKKYKVNKTNKRGHFLLLPSIFEKDFYTQNTLGKLNFLRKTGNYSSIKKVFKKRKFPEYIKPYGGGVYFALPVETVKKILSFHNRHSDFLEFNSFTLCADEVFFHSIIMQINETENLIISPSLTYVNWERPSGPLPVTFKNSDFQELKVASEQYLWARKFDEKLDKGILDRIDFEIL